MKGSFPAGTALLLPLSHALPRRVSPCENLPLSRRRRRRRRHEVHYCSSTFYSQLSRLTNLAAGRSSAPSFLPFPMLLHFARSSAAALLFPQSSLATHSLTPLDDCRPDSLSARPPPTATFLVQVFAARTRPLLVTGAEAAEAARKEWRVCR